MKPLEAACRSPAVVSEGSVVREAPVSASLQQTGLETQSEQANRAPETNETKTLPEDPGESLA